VTDVPVHVLLNWRSPDREIHRLLVTEGPLTVPALRGRLGYAAGSISNALNRMAKIGLATTGGQRPNRDWHAKADPNNCAVWIGRTQEHRQRIQPGAARTGLKVA